MLIDYWKKGVNFYFSISTFHNDSRFDVLTIGLVLTSVNTTPKEFNHLCETHKKIIPFKVE
jgi:hypothetical protein